MTVLQGILIAYVMAAPIIATLLFKRAAPAYVFVVAGAVGLLFTRLPDISSFELWGLKATLERQIAKAEVTIEQLRKLAAAIAKANLTEIAMQGQMLINLKTEGKFEIRDRIIGALKEIGVSESDIRDAQFIWVGVYCHILLGMIEKEAAKTIPTANQEIRNLPATKSYGAPSPEALREWALSKQINSPMLNKLLDEYTYLWATGEMKNPSLIPHGSQMPMPDDRH
jgi:hypothetical protein